MSDTMQRIPVRAGMMGLTMTRLNGTVKRIWIPQGRIAMITATDESDKVPRATIQVDGLIANGGQTALIDVAESVEDILAHLEQT